MKEKNPDFWYVIVGGSHPGTLAGYAVIALACAFGMMLVYAAWKHKQAEGTPGFFSWKYFLADNVLNLVAALFLIPIFVRVELALFDNETLRLTLAVGTGFGFKWLAKLANNFGLWTTKNLARAIAKQLGVNSEDQGPKSETDEPKDTP